MSTSLVSQQRRLPTADFPLRALGDDKTATWMVLGVIVGTTAKWSLTNVAETFDLLAVDEAWQMSWADLMQCATVSVRSC